MSIENIQFLLSKLDQEQTSHLQIKTELSQETKELNKRELDLKKILTEFQAAISNKDKRFPSSADVEGTSQLVKTIKNLRNEIIQNQQHSTALENELSHERIQLGMAKNRIEALKIEKEDLVAVNTQRKQEQLHSAADSRKVQNKKERLVKLRQQIEKQERVKQNLSNFIFVSDLIEQVIQNSSMIDENEKIDLEEVTPEIKDTIIEAKEAFQEAQSKFKSNNLTPFLQDADLAFRLGVKSLILLSEGIMDELADQPFIDQIFAIVNKGLILNTRHLTAVDSMLSKIQKGVEISPLASFANEIQAFYSENLSLLRILSSNEE